MEWNGVIFLLNKGKENQKIANKYKGHKVLLIIEIPFIRGVAIK